MANLNLSNFIIDRILSGVGYATDGSIYFKMDQCQDTSITCGSEATEIVDNVGAPVMTLYRAKTCEISGQNAILDMNLTAFQMGTTKKVAGLLTEVVEYVGESDGRNGCVLPMDAETYNTLCSLHAEAILYDAEDNAIDTIFVVDMEHVDYDFDPGEENVPCLMYFYPNGDPGYYAGWRFVITVEIPSTSDDNMVIVPAADMLAVGDNHTIALSQTPVSAPSFVYELNADGSLGEKYTLSTDIANATSFAYADGVITFHDDVTAGTEMFISYEYKTDSGIEIVNSAKNFPKSCKLVLKALGYNPCEKDNKLACYIIFPSFEMSPDFDLSLQAGETQAWSGKASQDYCSKDKRLMSIVVVDEDDEMF